MKYILLLVSIMLVACQNITPSTGAPVDVFEAGSKNFQNGDYDIAYWQFQEAASYGHRDAAIALAWQHAMGVGVPVNKVQAYAWFMVAANTDGTGEAIKYAMYIYDGLDYKSQGKAEDEADRLFKIVEDNIQYAQEKVKP